MDGTPVIDGMRRVRVVGTSGAGKTTVARTIARRLGVPHLELDEIQHGPDWHQRSDDEFRARLSAFLASAPDGWVVDGNYRRHTGELNAAADVLVWVDPPRRVVMARVLRRTLARGLLRQELWNGNRERLGNLLSRSPEENIVRWAWRTWAGNRKRYTEQSDGDPRWVRLTSVRETRTWLRDL